MRLLLLLLPTFACTLIASGCGARSSLSASFTDETGTGGAPPDAGTSPDAGTPPDASPNTCPAGTPLPSSACGPLVFSVETKASCTLSLTGDAHIDAEGFMTAHQCDACTLTANCNPSEEIPCTRVLTMTRFGQGHIMGVCDSTTVPELVKAFDALRYLGRQAFPRIAMVGGAWPCPPIGPGVTGGDWLGETLPPEYEGDPSLLAAQWDAVVVCGALGGAGDPWVPTLQSFVRDFGKGLLVSEDYRLSCPDSAGELAAVNALTEPAGFVFDPAEMDWATLSVDLPCVADYPPP